jgi:hypothetical protein
VSFPAPAKAFAANAPASFFENEFAARDEGDRRISTLQESGCFDQAADFAADSAPKFRRDWMISAYFGWGKNQPETAATHALALVDGPDRQLALQSVFSGWAHADPEGLAELAFNRPEGPEKNSALTKAIREWLHRDPEKAGDWIAAHEEVVPVVEKLFRDENR